MADSFTCVPSALKVGAVETPSGVAVSAAHKRCFLPHLIILAALVDVQTELVAGGTIGADE